MECKFAQYKIKKWVNEELIDTLWNVNEPEEPEEPEQKPELIDTFWNVNYIYR